MDFVAVTLLTHQDFRLECLFFFWRLLILKTYFFESNLSLVLLIKVLLIKKHVNLLFEERTLPQVFLLLGISLGRYHQVLSHKGKKGDGRRMAIQQIV